jgi:glycosyltransferase involved in cell wall biosynthesis
MVMTMPSTAATIPRPGSAAATWQRHDVLLNRCIPSVQAQTYPLLEHVVVSDGPDRDLFSKVTSLYPASHYPLLRYTSLLNHEPRWGGPARRWGASVAYGKYLAYLDDDDAYRPEHVAQLVAALEEHPEVGFAYSWMMAHLPDGRDLRYAGPPGVMMGTPMIMHRRELLEIATWPDGLHEDTALVKAWMDAGVDFGEVGMVTVDVYPGPATTAAIEGDPHNLNWGPY